LRARHVCGEENDGDKRSVVRHIHSPADRQPTTCLKSHHSKILTIKLLGEEGKMVDLVSDGRGMEVEVEAKPQRGEIKPQRESRVTIKRS
jgi:hypothetical protein